MIFQETHSLTKKTMTKTKVFKEFAPKFRKIYGVTKVNKQGTLYMIVFFKYKTETAYNRVREESIAIIDNTPHLEFIKVTGANYDTPKYDYCVVLIKLVK